MINWETLITFTYPHEAHMAKLFLEYEGIETMIQDEKTLAGAVLQLGVFGRN